MSRDLPVQKLVQGLIESVAQAQATLDSHSMLTAQAFYEEGLLENLGIGPTWYAIPETNLDLKIHLSTSETGEIRMRTLDADSASTYQTHSDLFTKINLQINRSPEENKSVRTLSSMKQIVEIITLNSSVEALFTGRGSKDINLYLEFIPNGKDRNLYQGGRWFVDVVCNHTQEEESETDLLASFIVNDEDGKIIFSKILPNRPEHTEESDV